MSSSGNVDGGTVTLRAGSTTLGTAKVVRGTATVRLDARAVARVGSRAVVASYTGTSTAGPANARGRLRVVRAVARVRVTAPRTTVGARPVVTVRVGSTAPVTGRVDVYAGRTKVGTARVVRGVARVRLARTVIAKPRKVALTVRFRGSAHVAPAARRP